MKAIRLTPQDVERYTRLRLEMLTAAPWAFGATPDDDKGLDVPHLEEMLSKDHYAIFGVEDGEDGELIAAAGIMRAVREKKAHRAIIWGVYVSGDHRSKGNGRAVVAAAVELAKSWTGVDFIDLSVSEKSPEARGLYQKMGFERWGREPETMDVEGRRLDEIYMTLRL
jgi:ribosomal protein S18 acetylase RimI-like enzyme